MMRCHRMACRVLSIGPLLPGFAARHSDPIVYVMPCYSEASILSLQRLIMKEVILSASSMMSGLTLGFRLVQSSAKKRPHA